MARKLPPLNALKAFEAAARHQSLVKAAAELNVTHAAISRQVRNLETTLRVVLFERTGRGLVLTEAGAGLARELSRGFDVLAAATARFHKAPRTRTRLRVTCEVLFAMMWLVPRLGAFTARHANVELVLDPTPRLVDFTREEVDLGVRYGAGRWPGVETVKLADAELIVVCAPELMKRDGVHTPADLPPAKLIQEQDRGYWTLWLEAAGVADRVEPRGPTLLADLAIGAALAGQGYVVADTFLAADALKAGRLVAPFHLKVLQNSYYLVFAEGKRLSRPARDFRDWLVREATAAGVEDRRAATGRIMKPAKRKR